MKYLQKYDDVVSYRKSDLYNKLTPQVVKVDKELTTPSVKNDYSNLYYNPQLIPVTIYFPHEFNADEKIQQDKSTPIYATYYKTFCNQNKRVMEWFKYVYGIEDYTKETNEEVYANYKTGSKAICNALYGKDSGRSDELSFAQLAASKGATPIEGVFLVHKGVYPVLTEYGYYWMTQYEEYFKQNKMSADEQKDFLRDVGTMIFGSHKLLRRPGDSDPLDILPGEFFVSSLNYKIETIDYVGIGDPSIKEYKNMFVSSTLLLNHYIESGSITLYDKAPTEE